MTAKRVFLDHFLGENGLFHQIDPTNPPSVIHGWKATDLLSQMVKRKNYLLTPISRQYFADALAENHNLKLEVCHTKQNDGTMLKRVTKQTFANMHNSPRKKEK